MYHECNSTLLGLTVCKCMPLLMHRTGPDLPVNVTMIPLSAATSETLPSSAFESLLPKLLTILQVTQRPEGTNNVRNKQDLLQAVSRKSCILRTISWVGELKNSTTTLDPGIPRSSEPGALARECASRWRAAHRGARRDHRHARETTRKEAVRFRFPLI